jgi:type IV pilus assembly protein PilV
MNMQKTQQGVGLIEVLVSLLILAVAILGFVALQVRATEATSEGIFRVQAINLARDISEKIRTNRSALANYETELSRGVARQIALNNSAANCYSDYCSAAEKADFDVSRVALSAQALGMTMNMIDCDNVENGRQCIYVAWGDTSATNGDGEDDCTTNGAYRSNSTCIVMETY